MINIAFATSVDDFTADEDFLKDVAKIITDIENGSTSSL